MYIYEDHMGGLYTSDRELSYDEVHCETCGDTDWLIGYAETKDHVLQRSQLLFDKAYQCRFHSHGA